MKYDFEDYRLNNEVKSTNESQKLTPTESDKWEMDVESTLDNLYHSWLGERLKGGMWVRDERIKQRMNIAGANFLISEIRPRFNTNSQFSVIDSDMIDEISSITSEQIMEILKYDYWKYNIDPNEIGLICDQVFHSLYIFLRISLDGGMRSYKGDKTKTIINKQEVAGGVY